MLKIGTFLCFRNSCCKLSYAPEEVTFQNYAIKIGFKTEVANDVCLNSRKPVRTKPLVLVYLNSCKILDQR